MINGGGYQEGFASAGEFRIKNPIPAYIRHPFSGLFQKSGVVVPYATQSQFCAHNLLSFLYELYEAAPTLKTVVSRKNEYAFGGGVDLKAKKRSGFVFENTAVTDEIKQAFVEWIEGLGLSAAMFTELSANLYKHEAVCGSQFLHIKITKSGDIKRAKTTVIHPMYCVRIFNKEKPNSPESNALLVSDTPITSESKIDTLNNLRVLPIYPNVTKAGGVVETVFQMNAKGYEGEFYGRPASNTLWNYIDYEASNYVAKVSGKEMTATHLILAKFQDTGDANENSDAKINLAHGLRDTLTSEGQGKGLGILFYPEEAPTVVKMDIARDPVFLAHMENGAETKIGAALGIDTKLIGLGSFSGGIGSSIYLDTLATTNQFSIQPMQERYTEFWDMVLWFLFEQTGETRFNNVSILFENKLTVLIDQLARMKNTNRNEQQNPTI